MSKSAEEIASVFREARAKAESSRPLQMLDSASRRTLERLRDSLIDDEREGFRHFDGPAHAKSDLARQTREQVVALNRVLMILAAP